MRISRSPADRPAPTAQDFTAFFDRHHAAVRAYAVRRVGADAAADVVQETFLVAWRRADQVPEDARPWLLGVARRVVLRTHRSASRREALAERVRFALPAAAPEQPPIDDPGTDGLQAVLHRLREPDRELLALVYWDGLSPSEAAVVLGCTPVAARVRLHRARRRLADLLCPDATGTDRSPAPAPSIEEAL
jgi:RNA polymerase sigma-70 factor (ECF subfamily)